MTGVKELSIAAGVLAAMTVPALGQAEIYSPPVDRPSYERPSYDRPADRGYDRPREEVYQGMRTGPTEQRQGNVTFITGGVTRDEADSFRAAMPRYALGLEFARTNAEFLSNVDVEVTDARGRSVLRTISDGPFLLANLPAGQYTVHAASNGRVKTQTVNVSPGQHRHLTFAW
jgi:hypothetical protein